MTAETFRAELDRMLLDGMSPTKIADSLGIRERGVRRRKASLLAEGHIIRTQGNSPGVNDVARHQD